MLRRLMEKENDVAMLLKDPFGNYVIQKALHSASFPKYVRGIRIGKRR